MAAERAWHPAWITLPLLAAAAILSAAGLARLLPPALWWQAALMPEATDMRQLLLQEAALPRIAVAWLAGAALALSALLFQTVLRNPLAEPATLGVSAGAHLALAAVTILAPALLAAGQVPVALCGAMLAMALVFGLAGAPGQRPQRVVVLGLFVGLFAGAAASVLVLLNRQYLNGVFLWGSGSLAQAGWGTAGLLAPSLLLAWVAAVLLVRPLTVMGLDAAAAGSLDPRLPAWRLAALLLAAALGAVVTAAVGIIAFLGLAAPGLARATGARRPAQRLVWAPLLGGAMLCVTDQAALLMPRPLPAGAATALLGGPLLLALMPRLRGGAAPVPQRPAARRRLRRPLPALALLLVALAAIAALAVAVGQGGDGWHLATGERLAALLPWRLPRIAAAGLAGAALAIAGVVLQRLTGNPLASPEVLGISAGAALGLIALLMLAQAPGRGAQFAASAGGATLCLLAVMAVLHRGGAAPERMLLTGIALATLFGALATLMLASGDPRAAVLIGWMAGSTYRLEAHDAWLAFAALVPLSACLPAAARWLAILPLGEGPAAGLGVRVARARLALVLLAGALTALGTLLVGPLSFAGVMAPHLVRRAGLRDPLSEAAGAGLAGAALMILADWAGRSIAFPYQLPAGLMAAFVAGPFVLWLLRGR